MILFPEISSFTFIRLEETTSTSSYLKQLCREEKVKEWTVVTARYQSAGYGQRGNGWEAEADKNLLFSVLLRPRFLLAREQFLLSQIVSLSIKEELDSFADGFSIKWPNDIYWKERKICGILIENNLSGIQIEESIAGIGVNINQSVFTGPAPNPVSLCRISGKEEDKEKILRRILQRLSVYYEAIRRGKAEEIRQKYAHSLFRKEGFHLYKDSKGTFFARIKHIEPTGRLILTDRDQQERSYAFKEVSYIINGITGLSPTRIV